MNNEIEYLRKCILKYIPDVMEFKHQKITFRYMIAIHLHKKGFLHRQIAEVFGNYKATVTHGIAVAELKLVRKNSKAIIYNEVAENLVNFFLANYKRNNIEFIK